MDMLPANMILDKKQIAMKTIGYFQFKDQEHVTFAEVSGKNELIIQEIAC